MIRKLVLSILCFFSMSVFAASDVVSQYLSFSPVNMPMCDTHAATSSAPNFCATFPPAAECNCNNHLHNPTYCSVMTNVYCSMLGTYGSLEGACKNQNITDYNECVADWNCYWDGKNSSKDGKPCNATGIQCTTVPRPTLSSCKAMLSK